MRTRVAVAVAALALLAAGCSAGAAASAPTWVPQPSFDVNNPEPGQSSPPASDQPALPGGSGGGGSAGSSSAGDPAVLATNLAAPTGLVVLPDGSALVGERTTGRVLQVQPLPMQPVRTVRTLTGLSTQGDGGLLDLALSPTFAEDGLVYAYETTPTDNRVVEFTVNGPVTPVLTGIPRGASGNAGRIAFDDTGMLLVATGPAGQPASATSLAGKLLRVTPLGRPAPGNPGGGAIWARTGTTVTGLCVDPDSGTVLGVEAGATGPGVVDVLTAGSAPAAAPDSTLPAGASSPGGCSVMDGAMYVASRDGQEVLATRVVTSGASTRFDPWLPSVVGKYGRLLTVVADDDGGLWLTTCNRDGKGRPVPTDERVLRISAGSVPGATA